MLDLLSAVCHEREWPNLLARAIGSGRPLAGCVERLRANLSRPDAALDAILLDRTSGEIVDAAAATSWQPLVTRAVQFTLAEPELLTTVLGSDGIVHLVSRHLLQSGVFPQGLVRDDFFVPVFDAAVNSDDDSLAIIRRLDKRGASALLDHPKCDVLLPSASAELAQGTVDEWWQRFLLDDTIRRPPPSLCAAATRLARSRAAGKPITLAISLLRLFPEITESDFDEWMRHTGFLWEAGDHQRVANILVERQWKAAAKALRWSWKRELKIVAWYAKELLSWFDQFSGAPEGADQSRWNDSTTMVRTQVKVLFLAANPMSSSRLALDEEARAIEEKIRDARHRNRVVVRTRWAVRPEDLQQALLEYEPTIVHFSGHGSGADGIVLHSANQNDSTFIAADALTDLFKVLKDGIRVVVLNACYSEVQARAIVQEIEFVVGMSDSIGDDAARVFAAAFYRGLAFGRSVQTAFELGINELKLMGLNQDAAIPQLIVRSGVDANAVLVAAPST